MIWPFKRKIKEPVIKNRSSKNGESITKDEGTFICYRVNEDKPPCPDCEKGRLLKGPQGCGSINCLCDNCRSEFSLFWIGHQQVIGERICDAGSCDPDRQKSIYGLQPKDSVVQS